MAKGKYLEHLTKVPMFEACSRKELQLIGRLAEDVKVKDGRELVREGSTGREFFVIVDGEANVSRNGRKVATLGPGSYFGELALLQNAPRNATITAASDMEVVVLGQREFLGLLNQVPALSIKVLKGMASRLRDADEKSIQ